MATLEQLQAALVAADKAGATDDAKALAQAILAVKSRGAPAVAAPQMAQIEDPGFLQTALIGTGRTLDRVGKGMQQLYYGATGDEAAQAELAARAKEDDRFYKPLQELRPWATGIGESLPSMAIPAGGSATLLGNAGRMALAGGLPGALEYGSAGERMTDAVTGALFGAAVPIGVAGAKSAKSLLEPLYQGGREQIASRLLNRLVGDDAANVAAKLRNAQPLVPGSMPTAAQVAESGGIAALERSASASNPEAYARRFMEQSSARLSALRSVAGDDAAMAAAKEARESAAKSLYGRAFDSDKMRRELVESQRQAAASLNGVGGNVAVDSLTTPGLRSLMQRPMFAKAAEEAKTLAANSGVFLDDPTKSLQGLHYIKLALDDMSQPTSAIGSAMGRNGQAALGGMRDALTKELADIAPLYGNARTTFQQMSRPINQMEIGQALLDKAAPALADFGALGRETGATFATAMRNGDALAQRATGMKSATIGGLLDPGQMALVEGVAKDLARKANAQDLGRGVGSDTFQKLAMQNIAQQSGMPKTVQGLLSLPGVSRATSWMYRDTDQQMQDFLAEVLLDPKKTADLLTKSQRKMLANNPALRQALEQSAMRSGGLLGLSTSEALAQP